MVEMIRSTEGQTAQALVAAMCNSQVSVVVGALHGHVCPDEVIQIEVKIREVWRLMVGAEGGGVDGMQYIYCRLLDYQTERDVARREHRSI